MTFCDRICLESVFVILCVFRGHNAAHSDHNHLARGVPRVLEQPVCVGSLSLHVSHGERLFVGPEHGRRNRVIEGENHGS